MKKTMLLAAAVATAVTSGIAVADSTLYGHIRLRVVNTDELRMSSGKLIIGFKGENDLGNGMSSFYKLELEHDNAQAEDLTRTWSNDHSYVGLKGDFGKFLMGNFSDFASWACSGTDIFQLNSGKVCSSGATNSRLGKSIAYAGGSGGAHFGVGVRLNDDGTNDHVLAGKYAADAFSVGLQITDGDSLVDPITVVGGTYKLGSVTIGLTIGDDGTNTNTAIAFAVPVAGGTFKVGADTGDGVADTTNVMWQKSLSKTTYTGFQYSSVDGVADDAVAAYLGVKF